MQMNPDQRRRLQMLLRRDGYNAPSTPSTDTYSSTFNSVHGKPQLKGIMSSSSKRVKLGHDDAGRNSQHVTHSWAQSGLQNDFIPKPLLPPSIFIDISLMSIPPEILFQILHSWIGPQHLSVTEVTPSILPRYQLSYTSPSNPDPWSLMAKVPNFPPHLLDEYLRFRLLSWLKDTKVFEDPYTFYMSTFLLCYVGGLGRNKPTTTTAYNSRLEAANTYQVPNTPCWDALNSLDAGITVEVQLPVLSHTYAQLSALHGLEKVKLDFTAEQYFAFFDVAVPPFNTHDTTVRGDDLYPDALCHGAAIYLSHTKSLTLHFGEKYKSANAWSNVSAPPWCEDNPKWEYKEARLRPRVCESGVVVDWILSYAWYGNFLQGIDKVRVTGDVQEWVKEKWHAICEEHTEYKKRREARGEKVNVFAVHRPDVVGMESVGKRGDEDVEQDGDGDGEQDGDESEDEENDEEMEEMDDATDEEEEHADLDEDVEQDGDGDGEQDGDESEDEENDEEMEEMDDATDEEEEHADLDEESGEVEYKPQDHYPPACTCAIGCWRLRGGKVEYDVPVMASWNEFEQYPDTAVGEWMDGGQLGIAAHW